MTIWQDGESKITKIGEPYDVDGKLMQRCRRIIETERMDTYGTVELIPISKLRNFTEQKVDVGTRVQNYI